MMRRAPASFRWSPRRSRRPLQGTHEGARLLLDSPEFAYLKVSYALGIEVFGQDLESLAATRAKMLNDRTWLETAGLALGAVLLVAATIALRGHRQLQRAMACTEAVARTDFLTDLPKRQRLHEELQTILARTQRSGQSATLLLLDLMRAGSAMSRFHAASQASRLSL